MKLKIQALGIVMVLFGSPIIHFFRDFKTIIPNASWVMPAFNLLFFGMIISWSHFKKIYKPNYNMAVTAWLFLGFSFISSFWSGSPIKYGSEIANYVFLIIYFYLICGVSTNVAKVIMPILLVVVLLDNFALIIAFLMNPFQHIGQRAVISNTAWGEGPGNPSLNSFMAFTGFIASFLMYKKANFWWKIIIITVASTSVVVMLLTLVRATQFTIVLCAAFYFLTNYRSIFKKSGKRWYEKSMSKSNFLLLSVFILGLVIVFFTANERLRHIFVTYTDKIVDVTSDVIKTVLGGIEGEKKLADASAANRVETFSYSVFLLLNDPVYMLYGYGYRLLYVDIPIMQVFLELGLPGLIIYLSFYYYSSKNILSTAYNPKATDWQLLLVYYFILLLMNTVSRGQPYDPYFWNYFLTIVRFINPPMVEAAAEKLKSNVENKWSLA